MFDSKTASTEDVENVDRLCAIVRQGILRKWFMGAFFVANFLNLPIYDEIWYFIFRLYSLRKLVLKEIIYVSCNF